MIIVDCDFHSREAPPTSKDCLRTNDNWAVHNPTASDPPAKSHLLYFAFYLEHCFTCANCGEEISMVLDSPVRRESYVEDCEVCCKPIEISYTRDDALVSLEAKVLE